jgi:hypothetical protein
MSIVEQIKALYPSEIETLYLISGVGDAGGHEFENTEITVASLKAYIAAVEDLIAQIELGDWTDENGHKLKNSEAFEKVKNV